MVLLGSLSRRQRRDRAAYLLEAVGLADRAEHFPSELSGGQQQRVAIARALANDPEIIIGDEMTGDLDSKTGFEIMELVRDLNQDEGKTVVYVTHDPRMAAYADYTVHLLDGVIVDRTSDPEDTIERAVHGAAPGAEPPPDLTVGNDGARGEPETDTDTGPEQQREVPARR